MSDNKGIEPSIMEGILNNSETNTEEAFKRSSRERKNLNLKNKRKATVRKRVFMIAVAGLVAGGVGSVAVPRVVELKEQHELDDLFEDRYGSALDDIVNRSSNPKNGSVDYIEIANEIRQMAHDDEELDNIIYEFYNSFGRKTGIPMYDGIVDKTIREIPKNNFDKSENYVFYDGLEDYIHEKGFSDLEQYDDIMRNKIISDYKYDNVKRGVK
ncbi:MAG: hypothetical protein IKG58_01265 [Bacilli bacterium]|nr:hypothetical protein [Bacilli bacterium]MBR3049173.1 hypothetical protein [Bacilli bacterium]